MCKYIYIYIYIRIYIYIYIYIYMYRAVYQTYVGQAANAFSGRNCTQYFHTVKVRPSL